MDSENIKFVYQSILFSCQWFIQNWSKEIPVGILYLIIWWCFGKWGARQIISSQQINNRKKQYRKIAEMIGLGIALGWFLILCGYNFREIQYKNSEQAKKDIFEERRKMIVDALVGEKQIGEVAYHPF